MPEPVTLHTLRAGSSGSCAFTSDGCVLDGPV